MEMGNYANTSTKIGTVFLFSSILSKEYPHSFFINMIHCWIKNNGLFYCCLKNYTKWTSWDTHNTSLDFICFTEARLIITKPLHTI